MRLLTLLTFIFGLFGPVAMRAGEPVVIELFTSQGCSSCPPADAFVRDLMVSDPTIIVLSWHVDYWDYLGWKDNFARPEFTARQEGYRGRWDLRSLYTPQIVIHGETQVIGSNAPEVRMYIGDFQAEMPNVRLDLAQSDGKDVVTVSALRKGLPASNVLLVTIIPEISKLIERGENSGKTLVYSNVVTNIISLGSWDGVASKTFDIQRQDGERFVLLVQADNFGPILGAHYLN